MLLDDVRACFDGVHAAYTAALVPGVYECAIRMAAKQGGTAGELEPDFGHLGGFEPLFA